MTRTKKGPQFLRFLGPVIEALRDLGGVNSPSKVKELILDRMDISEDDQSTIMSNGQSRFANQVHWARFYLVKAGYLDSSKRGIWRLTEKGLSASLSREDAFAIFSQVRSKFSGKEKSDQLQAIDIDEPSLPERATIKTTRIIRDTKKSHELKKLYGNKCQVCGKTIKLISRNYSEVHHLQPLGGSHNGPDVKSNMIVVCPNHHVEFDYRAIAIDPNTLELVQNDGQRIGKLIVLKGHKLSKRYLDYHYSKVLSRKH